MAKRSKLIRKLKRTYAKMLYAYAHRLMTKAYKLEDKAIWLELELKDQACESLQKGNPIPDNLKGDNHGT